MKENTIKSRKAKYQRLEQLCCETARQFEGKLEFTPYDGALPGFHEKIVVLHNFLPDPTFQLLRECALRRRDAERSHLPVHKKGATISYEELLETAPEIIAFYQSEYSLDLCSAVIGERVQPTPINDQVSCALLVYDRPRDHINWHYDYNFYNGRHFTALLPVVNEHHREDRLSSARLLIRRDGEEIEVPTPPNTFVLFEGPYVYHKVTRLQPDETRIIISMTYCTIPQASRLKGIMRRVKDVGYYGMRALWT
jgi:hypothetical protein